MRDHPDSLYAGQSRESLLELLVKPDDLFGLRISGPRKINPQRRQILSVEAGIDLQQSNEAPGEQPGADKRHYRQRDFADDPEAVEAVATGAVSRAVASFLEGF